MKKLAHGLQTWVVILLAVNLVGCGSGDEYEGFDAAVSSSTPNRYLTFFNRQGDLAAGDYILVVATVAAQSGTFSVSIARNDGSTTQVINGSWLSAGGLLDSDPSCAGGNRCFGISLDDASGVTITLTTALDGALYLVDDSGTPVVVASANANGAGASETLVFSESEIDETGYAATYYGAIDPGASRDTLQKFIALHGLDNPDEHVIFRDSKDLGYGRDMFMVSYPNSECGGQVIAFLVRNFSVRIVEGFAYGPVNLEAAVEDDLQHHFGSNAIEFSRGLTTSTGDVVCSAEPFTKFFTYRSDYSAPNAPHPRITRVDLDDRGEKAMPQPCISCHGGRLRPLDRNGDQVTLHAGDAAAGIGDTKSHFQAFEVDSFGFSDKPGYRRADIEEGLRRMNAAVYCSYPGSSGHPACGVHGGGVPIQTDAGEWSGDIARELLLGWYGDVGGNNALNNVGASFDDSYIPMGWRPMVGGPPVGADTLFTKVVGPNCFVCHGKQGTRLGSEFNIAGDGQAIDFSSWDKFISHADEIERLVFVEGRMPLGLLNYSNFWDDPQKAELLASFIAPRVTDPSGFEARRTDGNGNIILPGRVAARAGPDRVTRQNAAITLNAQASLFADSYQWQVISTPAGALANLSRPGAMRTDFSASTDGEYVVGLVASLSSNGASGSDTVSIRVDNTLATAPRELSFYTDISARLATCATTCHSIGGGTVGGGGGGANPEVVSVPVWWSDDNNQPFPVPPGATPSLGLYEQARVRVNLEQIEESRLLRKPSGHQHYGGERGGFDISTVVGAAGRSDYDMFVNWIAEGAACGGNAVQCVQ